jgi:hypothetical protein
MMAVFDVPAPLLVALDAPLRDLLSPLGALAVWGVLAALLSMGLYRAVSRQQAIKQAKADAGAARRRLQTYDGDFEGLGPLLGQAIGSSLKQLRLTLVPALIASLPLVSLLVWLDSTYGHRFSPAGTAIELRAQPDSAVLRTATGDGHDHVLRLAWPEEGERLTVLAVATIHKRSWWNILVGNPIGYLPPEGPVEVIEFGLPPAHYLTFGPEWLRGWEAIFLSVLLAGSLLVKVLFRIS